MNIRIIERPAFEVIGKKTWISGQDNELFGRFWQQAREAGLFQTIEQISGFKPGMQTGAVTLGISCVEKDPQVRSFDYWIAIEKPANCPPHELESTTVAGAKWAVFECRGTIPDSIVEAEIYAFSEWLPKSGYRHARAPEMEVYLPQSEGYCEFWLPIE